PHEGEARGVDRHARADRPLSEGQRGHEMIPTPRRCGYSGRRRTPRHRAGDGHAVRVASRSRVFFNALNFKATALSQNWLVWRLYSTSKTALPACVKGASNVHSLYSKHCSLSAQSNEL